jgi:glutathione S-transferase
MITVFGGGISRALRATWLLEARRLDYRPWSVDPLSGHEEAKYLPVNPAGCSPPIQDGTLCFRAETTTHNVRPPRRTSSLSA